MKTFFTVKNIATLGGVILSFVLPHIFFPEDEYEVIEVNPSQDLIPEETTTPEEPAEQVEIND